MTESLGGQSHIGRSSGSTGSSNVDQVSKRTLHSLVKKLKKALNAQSFDDRNLQASSKIIEAVVKLAAVSGSTSNFETVSSFVTVEQIVGEFCGLDACVTTEGSDADQYRKSMCLMRIQKEIQEYPGSKSPHMAKLRERFEGKDYDTGVPDSLLGPDERFIKKDEPKEESDEALKMAWEGDESPTRPDVENWISNPLYNAGKDDQVSFEEPVQKQLPSSETPWWVREFSVED